MRIGVFFALFLLAACAHELRSRLPEKWIELQSEHFLLRTDLPEEDARKAIRDFELVRSALLAAGWHSARPAADRTRVVELATALELRDFARQRRELHLRACRDRRQAAEPQDHAADPRTTSLTTKARGCR
jgi:hypothetical protein